MRIALGRPTSTSTSAAYQERTLRPRTFAPGQAPAWPRPVVTRKEDFADLLALQEIQADDANARRLLVLGTDATAVELQRWWGERKLTLPPLALEPAAARLYGVRGQPVAVIVDTNGRVAWAKDGYTPGDEAEWKRLLQRAGG